MKYLKPVTATVSLSSALLLTPVSLTALAEEAADTEVVELETFSVQAEYVVNERLDTATGLGLTLMETPQSVSILTADRIQDQNLRSLTDVVNNAAGISSKAYDSSRNAFSARGFDVTNYQIDGIPVTWDGGSSAGETQTDTALYERIEIVRGATGLLTGAGHPSASINLVRKHADSKELAGYVSASSGRWDTRSLTADVGSGLNSDGSIRGRFVTSYEDGESYVDYAGNEKSVFYGVVDADLGDNTTISLGASYQDNKPTASQWGGLPIFFSDGSQTDWDRSKTVGADWTYWATDHTTLFANLEHYFAEGWQLKLNANKTESTSDMRLLYLYGAPDPVTGEGMGASPARFDNRRTQYDVGVRLSGWFSLFGRQHEVVLGATRSIQDFDYYNWTADSTAPVGNFFDWDGSHPQPQWSNHYRFSDQITIQTGYFAATRLSVSDELKVVLGSRVSDWERTGQNYGTELDYSESGVVTPYAGVLYDLTSQHTLYASYTEIFQPQNYQDRNGEYLDPVTGKNYELGLKSRFFDDSLHATATLFRTQEDDVAVDDPDFVPDPESNQLAAYLAADGVVTEGYELELVGDLSEQWQISASYTRFEATQDDTDGSSNTVNTRFPGELLRLFTTYQWDRLTLGGGVNWEGRSYTEVTNTGTGEPATVEQEAYALVNVMARYRFDERLSAQLNVDNLFDETYYSQIGFYTQLAYGEPRNVTATLKYQF